MLNRSFLNYAINIYQHVSGRSLWVSLPPLQEILLLSSLYGHGITYTSPPFYESICRTRKMVMVDSTSTVFRSTPAGVSGWQWKARRYEWQHPARKAPYL